MGFGTKHVPGDPRPPPPEAPLKCPRCASANTKFCYYNNYNKSQPRHFCKACKRHWTHGGTLRNIPLGGGARRSNHKRPRTKIISSIPSTNKPAAPNFPNNNNHRTMASILYQALIRSSSPLLPTANSFPPDQNPNPNPGPAFPDLLSSGLSSSTTTAATTTSLIPNCYQTFYGANLSDSMEESTITTIDRNHINPWPSPDYSSASALELDHQYLSGYWSCSWNEIDAALTSSVDDLINVGWDDDDGGDDDSTKIKPLN